MIPETTPVDIPEELKQALLDNIEAKSIFETLPFADQKTYTRWIADAKKAETRMSRARRCLAVLVETMI